MSLRVRRGFSTKQTEIWVFTLMKKKRLKKLCLFVLFFVIFHSGIRNYTLTNREYDQILFIQ